MQSFFRNQPSGNMSSDMNFTRQNNIENQIFSQLNDNGNEAQDQPQNQNQTQTRNQPQAQPQVQPQVQPMVQPQGQPMVQPQVQPMVTARGTSPVTNAPGETNIDETARNFGTPPRPTTQGFVAPSASDSYLDMSTGQQGAMQQILSDNTGKFVRVEFLADPQGIVEKTGILYAVGAGYIVLYDEIEDTYTVSDMDAIKFVTFYNPQNRY